MNMKMLGMKSCLLVAFSVLSSYWVAISAQDPITDPQEVSALLAVRRHLKDPLNNLWNWRKKKDPCITNWNGVICSVNLTDGYQHVQELRLFRYNLSGTLAPELGKLSKMQILNFMWNNISGSIPKEIGDITALEHLLLSGNQISGPLPDKLGYLPNLVKFQLDRNYISGPIPESFAELPKVKHFHMNNNSISGQIPPVLYKLPQLQHFLLDNNNLSGYLPPQLSQMQGLTILQLDNNNFEGSIIPDSYGSMTKLFKLSLRNCNVSGTIPDLSQIRGLLYLDLSGNQLSGNIPPSKLSDNITTIDLSNNQLNGSIPLNLTGFPRLQKLSLSNNYLSGLMPSTFWMNRSFNSVETLTLEFENNRLSDISGILDPPPNVTIKLSGNPICAIGNGQNISLFCGSESSAPVIPGQDNYTSASCKPQSCPTTDYYEYVPALLDDCFCALPFGVGLQLRSPSISDFPPYRPRFEKFIATNVHINLSQLDIDSIAWDNRRLRMFLKFFPLYSDDSHKFSNDEVQRIANIFASFKFSSDEIFGPYDLLNFTLHGSYATVLILPTKGGISKGSLTGIVLGSFFCAAGIVLVILLVYRKRCHRIQDRDLKDQPFSKIPIKIEGVKAFSFKEMELATSSFSSASQVGQGGYGKVYKGILDDGTVVAIKRAQQGSLQGENEFYTEIELLSRLHHRNLVSLIGYCDEKSEQMLVYEFMPRGSVHDLLSARYTDINFAMRLQIALGAARGILYLHTEADPPIIHRDIKATNILLDSKYNAKVSDFGISKLAPLPDEKGNTVSHVSTVVKGTPGYLDPEYFLTYKLTEKSDVYSLGIVFLELLTGMQPISHGRNIVREVNSACESGTMYSIIDRNMGPCSTDSIKKFMALALRCSQDETKYRPSVLEVVRELENIASAPPEINRKNKTEETHVSTSRMSTSTPSSSSPRKTPHVSTDFPGSDLISGVVPSIRPR